MSEKPSISHTETENIPGWGPADVHIYEDPKQTGAGREKLKSVGVNIFSEDYCKTHTGQGNKYHI